MPAPISAFCFQISGFPRGCSSAGRAPALQAGGHRFDPGQLHHPPLIETEQSKERVNGGGLGFAESDASLSSFAFSFFNNLE